MHKKISSVKNNEVKNLLQLSEKSRERRKSGLFVIEGKREISLALKAGYSLKTLFFCPEFFSEVITDFTSEGTEIIEITPEVYQKLAYRTGTEGIIAIAKAEAHGIEDLSIENDSPLILVAEAPEKPGNIGALLRTADAANLDAVIIANPRTDLYNPNTIRSSVGCLFTRKIVTGTTVEILDFLKSHKIKVYCAALQAATEYHKVDFRDATAIVVGTEADGLSPQWLEESDQNVIIPMQGTIDSMNVSVAAGILIFEAKRQRGF